jgi:gamma-glutamyl:cysteine ligase YbdK (ATP-grasp superfamily)
MSDAPERRLFEGYGLELETMLVDADSLDVRPLCDRLLAALAGEPEAEVPRGSCTWSHSLALHVLRLGTTGFAGSLAGLGETLQEQVAEARRLAEAEGATLLPTGMHPWMDPTREVELWPHERGEVYRAYDRAFGCRSHGWGNLQGAQVRLPFAGDDEFTRLHAAARLVLPLIPGLAASSPLRDGRLTGLLDSRLEAYRADSARVPLRVGLLVPEAALGREAYQADVLGPLSRQLEPLDPEGLLRGEPVDARGVVPRFDHGFLELRLLDAQECPRADVAVSALVCAAVKAMVEERWCPLRAPGSAGSGQLDFEARALAATLDACIRDGDLARVEDTALRKAFGWSAGKAPFVRDLWEKLVGELLVDDPSWGSEYQEVLELYLDRGCLARRIVRAATGGREDQALASARSPLGGVTAPDLSPAIERQREVYRELALCLAEGRLLAV